MKLLTFHIALILMGTGLMSRVFASGLEDQGSIPGQVVPKTQKKKKKKKKKKK